VKSIARLPAVLPVCSARRGAVRACALGLRVRRPGRVNELAEKCARVPRGNGRRRSANDGSVRGRFRRRPNAAAAAARSSNPATQQKPLCVVVRSERSLDRSFAAHRSFRRSGRGVRVRRPRPHDNKRYYDKNATAAAASVARARETHSSPPSLPGRPATDGDENVNIIARARFAVQRNNIIKLQIVLIILYYYGL